VFEKLTLPSSEAGLIFAITGAMRTRYYDTDLNDAAWAWIAPYLPAAQSGGRPRTTDPRTVLNATFYLLRTGCQWSATPRVPASGRFIRKVSAKGGEAGRKKG
jgi:Putative transposase of IS4/5 family (DUF4096)